MDIKRARVFVVDDEKIMQTFVLGSLRKLGILDLYAFEQGGEALRQALELKPDLILSDIHMKPMGGIEFVRELRSVGDSRVCKTPVIFLTGDASPATVNEAVPLGVQGYLVKPPNLNTLAKKIETALRD